MITDRQKKILNVIIEEYISSAEPVSSQFLAQKHDFGICSASMRIEMKNLTELGFLEKPYISSGRIPTDKAYRIFVNGIFEDLNFHDELDELCDILNNDVTEFKMAKELTDFLASMSSSYIIMSFPQRNVYWQAGFNDIIKEPEFSNKDFVVNFLSFLEEFTNEQDILNLEDRLKVFIGDENPFKGAHDLSLICLENILNNKEKFRLSLIGPKRMDYYKNMKLVNSLLKVIDERI
ncbi:MAG TPA: hypothetical protein PKU93_00945 [Candidatus Pacearchaeota archaeon]|nr:hypothetical protein [Candidatus Pacearchaeota archaeon]